MEGGVECSADGGGDEEGDLGMMGEVDGEVTALVDAEGGEGGIRHVMV